MKFINHKSHNTEDKERCLECLFEADVLKAWYGANTSKEIDPEYEQEKVEILIDQAREDGFHSHGGRR